MCAASLVLPALVASGAGAQQPAAPPPAADSGAMQGVVYDSLTRGPLAGAYVQVVRAGDLADGRAVRADSAGAFRIGALPPGRYLVGFLHPLLDLLQVEVKPRAVDVVAGDARRVDLGVPDLARVRPVVCGSPQAAADSTGVLAGRVRDAADDAPVANATVVLTWSELTFGDGGVRTEHRRVPVTTGPNGSYVVCGLPAGAELIATATAPGRASGQVALDVPPRGFVVRDLALGDLALGDTALGDTAAVAAVAAVSTPAGAPAARPEGADSTPTPTPASRGTARLTGTVRDPSGRPLRGARAFVWGTAASTTAGENGTFVLGGLPAGTRTLEVRAIGFAMRRLPVDLVAGRAVAVDVRMTRPVTTLDPVTVFGTPTPPSLRVREFLERRRRNAFGRFLTEADIALMQPIEVTGALRRIPGLQVVPDGRFGNTVLGRGGGFGSCRATIVLNGMALPPGEVVDRWVNPRDVVGIEVYPEGAFAPPEYGSGRLSGCSVVLIWTW